MHPETTKTPMGRNRSFLSALMGIDCAAAGGPLLPRARAQPLLLPRSISSRARPQLLPRARSSFPFPRAAPAGVLSRHFVPKYPCPRPSRGQPQSIPDRHESTSAAVLEFQASKAGQGRGAPAAVASRSTSVDGARVAPADGSSSATGNPAVVAAAASPPLLSLEAAGFPTWWTSSSPLGSTEGIYPQGGFTNFLNSNSTPENFHLVGNTRGSTTISPNAPSLKRTRPVDSNAHDKETIVVDADESNEDERTEKRLNYTKEEDVRLASAWLRHSKDPVEGTDRHGDQYWTAVTKEYNKGTEVCRIRNRNQLKIRWDRIKKPVMEFHGCWVSTTKVYRSGFSDDQLMDIAEKMYAKDHSDKDFTLKHFWKVVRDERKWSAYVKREKEKENKGASNKGASSSAAEVVNLEDNPNVRPPGHRKAKDELHGKKKIPQAYSAISDKVDKFIEVSTLTRKDRDKMAETQQIMARSKVEAARLNDKAAEKQLKCKCWTLIGNCC